MLSALAERRVIHHPVAIVVAHPDDETIAAGGSLHLMRNLLLVHVTDGAPRALDDARREGFASPEAYGAAREAELQSALTLSGARPARACLGVPDQDASAAIPEIAARLCDLFRQHAVNCVLTHAYEGGHPDHDATALAVHLTGAERVEFAGYHAAPDGSLRTGSFLPAASAEIAVELSNEEAGRKAAMIACFHTQRAILSHFGATRERFRRPPAYDWTAPPHSGRLNYERWGWDLTGAEWRRRAASALGATCAA